MKYDIIEHHKGRKAIDHDFMRAAWEDEDRDRLWRKIISAPKDKHRIHGFDLKYASMGYVPFADGSYGIWIRKDHYRNG